MTPSDASHVRFIAANPTAPAHFLCLHCLDKNEVQFPIPIPEFCKATEEFSKRHQECKPKEEPKHGIDDGAKCGRDGCEGVMTLGKVQNCHCHISPPCWACVENPLVCSECGHKVKP